MKKLLVVLLVASLTFSLTFASINAQQETAVANEQDTVSGGDGATGVIVEDADGGIEGTDPISEVVADAAATAPAEDTLPVTQSGEEASSVEPTATTQENEVPYWQTDTTYQSLIQDYDAAAAAGHVTNASLTLTSDASAGLAGKIRVGEREARANGTNAPLYDNGMSVHLTPREGYPSSGMTSDRSVLVYIESNEQGDVYEATFFFGSAGFPEVPFTAFRTYVVLEAIGEGEASVSEDAAELDNGEGKDESADEEVGTLTSDEPLQRATSPYSEYVDAYWSSYYSASYDTNIVGTTFTVSEVLEDGTVKGTVAHKDLVVLGSSGDARALTQDLPQVGQTSTASYLIFNGTSYDAVFLFGDYTKGSTSGSAVGGLSVSLDLGSPTPAEAVVNTTEGAELLTPASAFSPLSSELSMLSGELSTLVDPSDLYVGYQFTAYFAGNYWWYNWQVYNAFFGMTINWDGIYINLYMACTEPGLYGPEVVNYAGSPVYGTISSIDTARGIVYVNFWTTGPASYYQDLAASNIPVSFSFGGDINLIKHSSAPSITNGNACYDLKGASYGLYASRADALANRNRLHTFTVNNNATGSSNPKKDLAYGTYYIKEISAPKGYALDPAIYTVNHRAPSAYQHVYDVPLGDPALTVVQKLDTRTGEAYGKDDPNGYLLADAEFTIRYWDGHYDTLEEAEGSGAPTRTWIIKTSEKGVATLRPERLVDGSDLLYKDQHGDVLIPLGSLAIQETTPPPGYLLPENNEVSFQQIKATGDPLVPVTRLNTVIVQEEPHEVEVEKLETGTETPVPNTEFTLYKESAPGAGDWTAISTHVTNEYGKCVFSPVAVGSYKLDETRANPEYAELEESGDSAHYFTIEPTSTKEVQIFYNDLIQVSIDVYKKTIPLTNTALNGTKDQANNHVGEEEYLYRFGAKNSSSTRVDEFVITDSLEYVTSKGYRMTTLWTGTAPEGMDYDGLMHILYKTNMTDASEPVVFAYNPMTANPYNANNPDRNMSVSIESGWRVWQECVSTSTAMRLDVADLNLKEGEYIVGLKAVYGGVVKGFYTGTGFEDSDTPQSYTGDRDSITTLSDEPGTFTEFELRDWAYAVVATDALLPISEMGNETVMQGSIRADLFRNWGGDAPVLTDIAKDLVETRVIETFSYEKESLGIRGGSIFGSFSLPITGDSRALALLAFICLGAGVILFAASLRKHRKNKSTSEEK